MLEMWDEHACGDPEEFRDKLSLLRFTLAPREQEMFDELLLHALEPADSQKLAPEPVAAGFGHLAVPSVN